MKRLWLALTLVLLMLGTLVPCDALCTSAHQPSTHACCRQISRTPEVKTCCAPRPAQQSAIPQVSQLAPVAVHLHDCAPSIVTALLSPIVHPRPLMFPPDAAPAPPLVLRT
ncbi:hypothetical protein [Terracidiphilus gabretensis]|uniref:hypothetical protein n=1 Tax=Terracidiphilus gabretensis TaxID=1577687 RepID=UPI00071B3ED4|nr:hypothetical protein [Terracidiphilus gabretensis]